MVQKIKQKNLLQIPDLILKRVGLNAGDYVDVTDDGYKIIITPKISDQDFVDEEWEKIEKITKEKKAKKFSSGNSFIRHLDKISHK